MMRRFAVLIFLGAVGATTLMSSGLVVPPHSHAPGTPLVHDHVFATYRYSIYLMRLATPAVLVDGPRYEPPPTQAQVAATLVLGLLVALALRLPNPTRRPLARLAPPQLGASQWNSRPLLVPPRGTTLVTTR